MTQFGARKLAKRVSLVCAGAFVLGLPASAQAPGLSMLGKLDKGLWELRFRDDSPARRICVRSGQELIKLSHRGSQCRRYIIEDAAAQVTVQYTCKGDGYARTNIRRENGSLVQVQAQGIEDGLPFEFSAEARRVGACR